MRIVFGLAVASAVFMASAASATVVNGEFGTGDFSGFTVNAFNVLGQPIVSTPFASVETQNGDPYAELTTGLRSQGLLLLELVQTISIDPAHALLSFDVALLSQATDPNTASGSFLDVLSVVLGDGSEILFDLDATGAQPDPFGSSPVPVSIEDISASDPFFTTRVIADFSAFVGTDIDLAVLAVSEDDGQNTTFAIDNIEFSAAPSTVIPLPGALPLMLGGIAALSLAARRRRRDAA